MLRKGHILAVFAIGVSVIAAFTVVASAEESLVPSWIKTTVGFWINGDAGDQEFINAIKWMLENNVLQVTTTQDDDWKIEASKLYSKNQELEEDNRFLNDQLDEYYGWYEEEFDVNQKNLQYIYELEAKNAELYDAYLYWYNLKSSSSSGNYYFDEPSEQYSSNDCSGSAGCISGYVTEIVDGDTIKVDGQSIRFALANTPEYGQAGYDQATNFIQAICPMGSAVLVDEDDGQTQRSYGRIIAVVYCNNINLNQAVLEQGFAEISTKFCNVSEFSGESWAQNYGCAYEESPPPKQASTPPQEPKQESTPTQEPKQESTPQQPSCDPSYPDVCIAPYPPDLDCGEISYKNFRVVGSDPHRFDGDGDGIGCES